MGGIADYCGAHVLEMTIDRAVWVAFQWRDDDLITAHSHEADSMNLSSPVKLKIEDFFDPEGHLKTEEQIRFLFSNPLETWAGYLLGGLYFLIKEGHISHLEHGFTLVVKSDIPMGAGVSSSAALEIASLNAICHQTGLEIPPLEVALLAQKVENHIVGAPCGIMDQVAVHCGSSRRAVSILCQPAEILDALELPEGVDVCGLYTGERRSTGADAYRKARTAAFMGLSILSKKFGFDHLQGYLCNMSLEEFRSIKQHLPMIMSGDSFLSEYGPTQDTATCVQPHEYYKIRNCVEHPIYENHRVQNFLRCIQSASKAKGYERRMKLIHAGRLMYGSNFSYRNRVGLGSSCVDTLVRLLRTKGMDQGIYGAKITGGGGGGTVAVLYEQSAQPLVLRVFEDYQEKRHMKGDVFLGSSEGASHFQPIQVTQ